MLDLSDMHVAHWLSCVIIYVPFISSILGSILLLKSQNVENTDLEFNFHLLSEGTNHKLPTHLKKL